MITVSSDAFFLAYLPPRLVKVDRKQGSWHKPPLPHGCVSPLRRPWAQRLRPAAQKFQAAAPAKNGYGSHAGGLNSDCLDAAMQQGVGGFGQQADGCARSSRLHSFVANRCHLDCCIVIAQTESAGLSFCKALVHATTLSKPQDVIDSLPVRLA